MTNAVHLDKFDNSWYKPGGCLKRTFWYFINLLFFRTPLPFPALLKVLILKAFGAKAGVNVIIKPSVNIKYPWFLEIGNNVWIGEGVWIDNLTQVKIGSNVCISQGGFILTGNHDYKKETFDLMVKPVVLEDGVWVGAKAIVCPGVTAGTHSVITAGSIVTKDTTPYMVYRGNPAVPVRERKIEG